MFISLRCPKCGSTHIYVRIKTNEIVCQQCGTVSPKNKEG